MDPPTLLCIDDRPQMLKLRKSSLESYGYCVKFAASEYGDKGVGGDIGGRGSTGVQTGRLGRGSRGLPH
jgi:hypothetical protein